jgi:hypothetical protein
MEDKNMKNTKIFGLSIAIFMVVSILFGSVSIKPAQAATVLYLDPAAVNGSPPGLGDTFSVAVRISDVNDLVGWGVKLSWSPTVLQMVYPPPAVEGPFLTALGPTLFTPTIPNNVTGVLTGLGSASFARPGATGSGLLCTMQFRVVGYGTTNIAITFSELYSGDGTVPITHTATGTAVNIPPPPSTAPVAKFNLTDGATYYVGTSFRIDGSISLPGYDSAPAPGHNVPITAYDWTVAGPATGTDENGAIVTFTGNTVGTITVSLRVTATDMTPPTAGDYTPTSTLVTKTLNIVAVPTGAAIDVYTERGGQTPMAASDAFGPQELITLYAQVIYNGAPVAGKDVAFEIVNKRGEAIGYIVRRTDASGIATGEYRLPWPYPNPEAEFGTWTIVATVDVAEQIVSDNCTFMFNYIVTVTSVRTLNADGVTPQGIFNRGSSVLVEFALNNIRTTGPVNARVTITIYDNCSVPVGSITTQMNNLNTGASTPVAPTVSIPSWAFVGQATIYVNVLTGLPALGGVPYCPETTKTFSIIA